MTDLYPPDQSFDLSISDGVGAGLLVAPDGTTDANALFCMPGVGIRFTAADSIGGDSVRVEFGVQPCSGGATGPSLKGGKLDPIEACTPFGAVVVRRGSELDHFTVTLLAQTIRYGDMTTITVVAENDQNNEIPLDPDTPLAFSVNHTEYGSFIDVDGSTSTELSDVRYDDARSARIRFVANGVPPIFPTTFGIHVAGLGKSGTGNLTLLPVPVRLELTVDSAQVYPTRTGGNSTATLRIRATRNDQPVEGVILQVVVSAVDRSGGHDHVGVRPVGGLSPSVGETDTEGMFVTTYTSSAFGGIEKIIAFVPSNPSRDSVEITVRVPDLVNLGSIETNLWNLTGNVGPTSYSKCVGTVIRHPENHYAARSIMERLQQAIVRFFAWSGTSSGGGRYLKLGINDMSLVNGGLFDICSDWEPGHKSHRIGISVDIDSSAAELFENPGQFVPLDSIQIRRLTHLMAEQLAWRAKEVTIHYEF